MNVWEDFRGISYCTLHYNISGSHIWHLYIIYHCRELDEYTFMVWLHVSALSRTIFYETIIISQRMNNLVKCFTNIKDNLKYFFKLMLCHFHAEFAETIRKVCDKSIINSRGVQEPSHQSTGTISIWTYSQSNLNRIMVLQWMNLWMWSFYSKAAMYVYEVKHCKRIHFGGIDFVLHF